MLSHEPGHKHNKGSISKYSVTPTEGGVRMLTSSASTIWPTDCCGKLINKRHCHDFQGGSMDPITRHSIETRQENEGWNIDNVYAEAS